MTASTEATSDPESIPAHGTPASPAGVVVAFRGREPGRSTAGAPDGGAFTIDCAGCAHQGTDVCDDCVVTFIVGRSPGDALVVDADEARAVRLLERAGLVPGVRHEARACGE